MTDTITTTPPPPSPPSLTTFTSNIVDYILETLLYFQLDQIPALHKDGVQKWNQFCTRGHFADLISNGIINQSEVENWKRFQKLFL